MARYRKIDPRIWNDEKFRALSDSGKLAFLFVLTHPHMTSLGAMRGTVIGLAEELKASRKPSGKPSGSLPGSISEGFREAIGKGLLEVDEDACYIGAKNFLRYNGPESPNVVRSWETAIELIPECKLKVQLMQRVRAYTESLSEGFGKALPKAFAKASPNQEQEQEQEQELEQEEDKNATRSSTEVAPPPSAEPDASPFVFPVIAPEGKPKAWVLPASKLAEYRQTFIGVNVEMEIRNALQWCRDNPRKRKTADGMTRFLFAWLKKEQNSGRPTTAPQIPPKPRRNPPTFHPDGSVTYDDDVS